MQKRSEKEKAAIFLRLQAKQKVHLTWNDVVEFQFTELQNERSKTIVRKILQDDPTIKLAEDNWIMLETKAQFNNAARSIAEFYEMQPKSIERSMYLQNALFSALESEWIEKEIDDINVADIRNHIKATPPVSESEFKAAMKTYGDLNIKTTIDIARAQEKNDHGALSTRFAQLFTRTNKSKVVPRNYSTQSPSSGGARKNTVTKKSKK